MGLLLVVGCRQVFGIHDPGASDDQAIDAQPDIDAAACTAVAIQCVGPNELRTCSTLGAAPTFDDCGWGCVDDGATLGPHCGVLQPAGGAVTPMDLQDMSALADVDLANATVNGTDGSILLGQTTLRAPGLGVISGIDYEVRGKVAVFRMSSALVADVALTGAYAIAIVTNGDLTIGGAVDARGACADKTGGPGGSNGGVNHNVGAGLGGGNNGTSEPDGGAGAGYGAAGGNGGSDGLNVVSGGASYGDAAITALVGGSGGGGGGTTNATASAHGGGGGGGIQLVSNSSIVITGTINAGGCGGLPGITSPGGGGGGGGGGTVLLEAPSISIVGAVAANGGGGGGGGTGAVAGGNATPDAVAAAGGSSPHGAGGAGGNAIHSAGNAGANNLSYAGGGGGAVGRLRFETRGGTTNGFGTTSPMPVIAAANVQ